MPREVHNEELKVKYSLYVKPGTEKPSGKVVFSEVIRHFTGLLSVRTIKDDWHVEIWSIDEEDDKEASCNTVEPSLGGG